MTEHTTTPEYTIDEDRLKEVMKLSTGELVRRLTAEFAEGTDRRQRLLDLTEVAIEQLPNDTDADQSLAVLEALRDRLLTDGDKAYEVTHLVTALIQRAQATATD